VYVRRSDEAKIKEAGGGGGGGVRRQTDRRPAGRPLNREKQVVKTEYGAKGLKDLIQPELLPSAILYSLTQ